MTTTTTRLDERHANWQGMNWIRQDKRLAIYLRDGLACAWCGAACEEGVQLTLDHVVPHVKGGSNHESNLVTACKRCNDSRGARTVQKFAKAVAHYANHGLTAEAILMHVNTTRKHDLEPFRVEARNLMRRRGASAAKIVQEFAL